MSRCGALALRWWCELWVTCEEQQWEYLGLARSRKLAQREVRQPGQQVNINKYYNWGLQPHPGSGPLTFNLHTQALPCFTIFPTKCNSVIYSWDFKTKTKPCMCLICILFRNTTSDGFISMSLKEEKNHLFRTFLYSRTSFVCHGMTLKIRIGKTNGIKMWNTHFWIMKSTVHFYIFLKLKHRLCYLLRGLFKAWVLSFKKWEYCINVRK